MFKPHFKTTSFQFNFPLDVDSYVHRVGRTAPWKAYWKAHKFNLATYEERHYFPGQAPRDAGPYQCPHWYEL